MSPVAAHIVPSDPGTDWIKDEVAAIDTPPDAAGEPATEGVPTASAVAAVDGLWPASARRTGVYGVVTPNVVPLQGGGWRMYYTQILPRVGYPRGANDYDNATTRILSATSPDGLIWSPEPGVRLSSQAGGGGDYRVVSPEVVSLDGGTGDGSGRLRMYYECSPGPQSVVSTIGSALSTDGGITWTAEAGPRLAGGGSYNSPRLLILDDGRWRLYCSARGEGIVSAISVDGGLTFERESGMRVTPDTEYEALTAFAPEVLRIAGGGYRMYYAGYAAPNRAYVLSAVSDDGLTWQKEPQPVIEPGGPWDRVKCSEMCVMVQDCTHDTGVAYRMFYEACDGTAKGERGVWRIGAATSVDAEQRT